MSKRKLRDVSSKYGAPMGRGNNIIDPEVDCKFSLTRLKWVDGDYDQGGAYWGNGCGDFIYWAWSTQSDDYCFVRAFNRREAKVKVRAMFPNAEFFN